ncbi:MAG TPA: hypothetical protein VFW33_14490 [Gemmataceae bacterium]|nr:hypothetical protein [Gemmataceae bacterium]
MNDAWEITRDGAQVFGPYTWSQLLQLAGGGSLLRTDMVRLCGTVPWGRADEVGVFGGKPVARPVHPRPTPTPRAATRAAGGSAQTGGSLFLGVVGLVVVAVSLVFVVRYAMMDTAVRVKVPAVSPFGTPTEERVHNIGLMDERRNGLTLSLAAAVAGAALVVFVSLRTGRREAAAAPAPPPVATVVDRLTALKKLADDGHITPAEHEQRRQEILKEV